MSEMTGRTPAHRDSGLTQFETADRFVCERIKSHCICSPFDTPVTASGGVIVLFYRARHTDDHILGAVARASGVASFVVAVPASGKRAIQNHSALWSGAGVPGQVAKSGKSSSLLCLLVQDHAKLKMCILFNPV